jgi:predicted metal-dependent hydrolase
MTGSIMFAFLRTIKPIAPGPAKRKTAPVGTPRVMALAALPVPVEVRVSPRSRRLSMRVDAVRNVVRVSTPPQISDADIKQFIGRHMAWLQQCLSAVPPRFPFHDGAVVPILGIGHHICHRPGSRNATRIEVLNGKPVIMVGGDSAFLNRRVTDFLKAQARNLLTERAREKAGRLNAKVAGVTVRDTKSRWGSCSSGGRLSFCWRLIMAPDPVFDYVVAHEVAHLKEMNHSPRFWALCASLTASVETSREWLRVNGARLHAYG